MMLICAGCQTANKCFHPIVSVDTCAICSRYLPCGWCEHKHAGLRPFAQKALDKITADGFAAFVTDLQPESCETVESGEKYIWILQFKDKSRLTIYLTTIAWSSE